MNPVTVYFAKRVPSAIIPAKRGEDAGYDVFPCDDSDITIQPAETLLIHTGIISAFSSDYYIQLAERGSMGSMGVGVRGGVIDSGFRGEWLVGLTNHNNIPVVIPRGKAVCQALLLPVPETAVVEVTREELMAMPSIRGGDMMGSTDLRR